MTRTEIGRITVGAVYRYHGLRIVQVHGQVTVEDCAGELYRVLRFAYDGVNRRDVVVYEGLEGHDLGRAFVCSLADFAVKFTLEVNLEVLPQ